MKTIYVGAFISEASKAYLLERIPPVHKSVFGDHVTLVYMPTDEQLSLFSLGADLLVMVESIAFDGKGQAVLIKTPRDILCKNENPHITISCAEGVKPVYSNELLKKGSLKLAHPLFLSAVVDTYPRRR